MKSVTAILFGVAVQTLFGGLTGGLILKPLAARVAKVGISLRHAWAIEFGAVFFTVSVVAIIDLLGFLDSSGLIVALSAVLAIIIVSRTVAYTQFIEGPGGRSMDVIDALPLALVQSGAVLAVGISVRAILAIGNHLGVSLL
jgi:hypothetical protein